MAKTISGGAVLSNREPNNPYNDNLAAAEKAQSMRNSKNIDVKYNFVRKCTKSIIDNLINVNSNQNVSDGFTKSLAMMKFEQLQ